MKDIEIYAHKEWLGFLQPVGLVVSPPALVAAQAVINRNVVELQQRLLATVSGGSLVNNFVDSFWISDFPAFTVDVLGWQPEDVIECPEDLAVSLPEYGEVLRPTYAVPEPDNGGWLMLVQVISTGTDFDTATESIKSTGWHASPQAKFERLLREKEIPVGLLSNGTQLRLTYAPRGESSGYLTFPIQAMCEVTGRLILSAMEMLLGADRLFNVPSDRRLVGLLQNSRKYQNEVSTKLSEQVLDALWELLRGFQSANEATNGCLLENIVQTDSQYIYGGLTTVLLRLVFLLYTEDEGLMPQDPIYTRNYSVTGLYDRLREDAGNYPDTMDQRYGAWAWLLSLFRLIYDGGAHADLFLPARHGQLFDPDEYAFLEGRSRHTSYTEWKLLEPPRISDGVIHHVLQKLLVLDGERLSYRSLDVEQIGSVYEAIMGYEVEQATMPAIGVWSKPKGTKTSVTVVVSVDEVLKIKSNDRAKYLKDVANCEISGKSLTELKQAEAATDLVAAIGRKVSDQTPGLMPVGSLYLQPGEERRRSGSHYTPRALTEPIVRETLRPVLEALGESPTPEQILGLKVCDLAVGSGAFLVESCRQLAEKLVGSWNQHNTITEIPFDEEPLLYARRLVAQRCLYGVDKNPFAVNLAKLSLWLVTLAKKHPFTFLDHALKCGDSLVGLTRDQIVKFNWERDTSYDDPELPLFKENFNKTKFCRHEIQVLDDENYEAKRDFHQVAEELLLDARLKGDLVIASFFASKKEKARRDERNALWLKFRAWQQDKDNNTEVVQISKGLRQAEKPVKPFHWEIEFPEVFDRENPGFDAIVGNPPFMGGKKISGNFSVEYLKFLQEVTPEAGGQADLVIYFFRKAFTLLRESGCFGLIATNTISQGDTRYSGLRWICKNGGTIYLARKRCKWIGEASVLVSIINVCKGKYEKEKILNNNVVEQITAYLYSGINSDNPHLLLSNNDKSFKGVMIGGSGFTFDDLHTNASTLIKMQETIGKDKRNLERVFPYIGGDEILTDPEHKHQRYVIYLDDLTEKEAWDFPDLMKILQEKVYSSRKVGRLQDIPYWKYERSRPSLKSATLGLDRVLVRPYTSKYHVFAYIPSSTIVATPHCVIPFTNYSPFAVLQSRIHEIWALFFGSSLEDRPVYTPTDCFETFPFPENWQTNPTLETIGKEYYEYRAALLVRNNEGLTNSYNRFHDPDENHPHILKLRQLHAAMDCAVLDAYGWSDISTECTFLLDYEEEEEENTGRQKKKPWRYRWSEAVHDEVLARLLQLNHERAEAEILAGQAANKSKAKATNKKASKKQQVEIPIIPDFPVETAS